ncbi:hypothetical protein WAK64_17630 [Bacillus spongiae]|uniref:Uncharacterized protein n=1 Tax=Bacillus spongiae TaxID=2683610 RepID=A0ABU8HII6_9BACI
MKELYILLTDTGTTLNRTIKLVTNAPYNHASISLDEKLNHVFSFGRKQPINPLYGGFIQEDFVDGTFSWYPDTTCAIYKLSVSEREYEKVFQLISEFEKHKHSYRYNFFGLFGVPLNYPIEIPFSYFCSQFVADLLKQSGIKLFNKRSSLVSPDDFRKINRLELIYEGRIYDYPALQIEYKPREYDRFPFRKYIVQQLKSVIVDENKNDEREYFFRDGFIKPKKIMFDRKMKTITTLLRKVDQ